MRTVLKFARPTQQVTRGLGGGYEIARLEVGDLGEGLPVVDLDHALGPLDQPVGLELHKRSIDVALSLLFGRDGSLPPPVTSSTDGKNPS